MKRLSAEDVRELMDFQGEWAVSLFMSTHRAGAETRQDPIRFKNLVRLAEHAMENRGIVNGVRRKSLEPVMKLMPDSDFWQHQSDGLAAFVGPDFFRYYTLPFHFAENALVDTQFHITPLLPVYHGDGRFYLLSLSQKRVRVLACTRDEIEEIQVVGVPSGIEEYMQYVELLGHKASRLTMSRGGGEPAAISVHGGREESEKQRLLEFFREVDRGLHDLLRDESVPLMVACVDFLYPIYREANTSANLLAEHLTGNPEAHRLNELHARAWELAAPHFASKQEAAVSQYERLAGGDRVSRKLREIVPAAVNARIETLLVASDQELWGVYNAAEVTAKESKTPGPGDVELLNLSAVHTMRNGGTVYAMPSEAIPHGAPMVAIYRY